jgi:hypothetical protein
LLSFFLGCLSVSSFCFLWRTGWKNLLWNVTFVEFEGHVRCFLMNVELLKGVES